MSLELFSILVLLGIFAAGTLLSINLGLMSFVAAFLVGQIGGGLTVDELFAVYPGDLFILLAGVTFLFAIAQTNGTIDLIVNWGVRAVRGNVGLVPWTMFTLAAVFAAAGAITTAAVALVAPAALRFASQYSISPLIMGVMVVQGSAAGAYSPLNPFGVIVAGVLNSRGLPSSPISLFVGALIFNLVVGAIAFVAFGGLRLLRQGIPSPATAEGSAEAPASGSNSSEGEETDGGGLNFHRAATLIGIVTLVVLSLFEVDVGFGAMLVALVLLLMAPGQQGEAFSRVPWQVIVLITGIVTYVGVLEEIGAVGYVQGLIDAVGSPLLASLAASYVGGIISAFASTTALLGSLIPLAAPILQDSAISAIGVVTAIAVSSAIVDVSPFSTNGALLMATAQNADETTDVSKFFRQLLGWAAAVTLIAPLVAWFVFVVVGVV